MLAKRPAPDRWETFLHDFPVTLSGAEPSQEALVRSGYGENRSFYNKWRNLQRQQRVQHILGKHLADLLKEFNIPQATYSIPLHYSVSHFHITYLPD